MRRSELFAGRATTRGISLPTEMDKALRRQASRNYRSISAEIQLALARYLDESAGRRRRTVSILETNLGGNNDETQP